ncbi:hypothetical protein ENU1_192590, partial [Entamoeba nuttalli P19]
TVSLTYTRYYISLSSNNYIIKNSRGTNTHAVFTYPYQWLKYDSSNQISFNIYRKKEPYQKISFKLTIKSSNEGTTIITEEENSNKTISTVIISSSKQITELSS